MRRILPVALALAALLPLPARAAATTVVNGDAYATVDGDTVSVGNALFDRTWRAFSDGHGFGSDLTDKRAGGRSWHAHAPCVETRSSVATTNLCPLLEPVATTVRTTPAGVEAVMRFALEPGAALTLTARAIPGVAAVRTQATIHSDAPLPLNAYTLEQIGGYTPADVVDARAINFSGGADWRDQHDYRSDTIGADFDANAEWLETSDGALGFLLERRNYRSSRMRWYLRGGEVAVDLTHDHVYLGPFEEVRPAHPPAFPARVRTVPALGSLALEPVVVALGSSTEDLQWQAQRMLRADRTPFDVNTVNFNTDRVRGGPEIGVRDGVDWTVFQTLLPLAKDLGVETFVLDDGWQLYNGDWRSPDVARYPAGLGPVRDALEQNGMRLGLWMAPGSFHPSSQLFRQNPEWACTPTGDATAAYNALVPEDGSNAAGIGVWNLSAIGRNGAFKYRLRDDIANLVSTLNVREFKFDFLVWVDCANALPADMYQYRDEFFDMIDSLARDFPSVGFGLDETNDYRGFPYESTLRGATWFQNGNPAPDRQLHNVWTMAPYVPGSAIGQAVTLRNTMTTDDVDEAMAVALAYHMTFWTDIRELAARPDIRARAKLWTDFFKQHRSLNGFAYPLLSDPMGRGRWSGLQPWDAEAGEGYAMLYRLGGPASETVAFKAVRAGVTYRVTDVTPTNAGGDFVVGDYDGATLRSGIPLTIAAATGARILRIKPV